MDGQVRAADSKGSESLASSRSRGHVYASLLARVEKPGRYLGGEEQSILKDNWDELTCRFVLAFPDLYEIGMSHLGTRILYDLINKEPDLCCERAFSPWVDMERELRACGLPLVSLETSRPLCEFDVVGVSLQYELSYSNVLLNLELGGVPLRSADRRESDPIVIAGGPTATHPEPLAPFIDAFLVGEAEEVLPTLLRTLGQLRRAGASRFEQLAAASALPGIYVPEFYRVELEPRTGLQVVVGRSELGERARAPFPITRVWVRDLGDFPFPTRFPVPYAQAIFDRASVEITRGCTEGCRFCQAGMIYRPVRERAPNDIVKAVLESVDASGFDSTSLTALSTADVSCIDPLIKALVPELVERKVKLGIASLRAYGLSDDLVDEIKKVGIDGLTFAPEAGTQRMRDVINKNVSDEDIDASARRIFERGYERIKMYFIIGLPTEEDEDVVGIIETGLRIAGIARQIRGRQGAKVTVSVSQHVPKPHTPFQWAAMDSMVDLRSKVELLRNLARRGNLGIKTHEVRESWLECLFARGDRRMGEVLERAYRAGARFDGWGECFKFETWLEALRVEGIEPDRYTSTLPLGVPLPWSHLDVGLEPGFLEREYKKAVAARTSPPCGKPLGEQVHHRTLESAQQETRRLVCYDCGVACDLTAMRSERVDALIQLEGRTAGRDRDQLREESSAEAQADAAERARIEAQSQSEDELIPAASLVRSQRLSDGLKGRLAPSLQVDGSAFKANAEAAFSRLRLLFAKQGTLTFLSHLDLVRMMPRMFRRAGIELAFSRGFNPKPRMSFGPALALGMSAEEEVVDIDVILPESPEDLGGLMDDATRDRLAGQLCRRLQETAPPGLVIRHARLVAPGERLVGELVVGASYAVELRPDELHALEQRLASWPDVHDGPGWSVIRDKPKKKRSPGASAGLHRVDLAEVVRDLHLHIDGEVKELRFTLVHRADQSSARPREVAESLLGQRPEDYRFVRRHLLARDDLGQLRRLGELGIQWRSDARRRGEPSWSMRAKLEAQAAADARSAPASA